MIKVLSEDTIKKIAAGEVIERPASVVKELVENSIDAGATRISVEISEGGKSFIEVTDNGSGILKEEIPLAFHRHATSKLKDFNDLYNIYSLGFRGEALASIVSVSHVTVNSRAIEEEMGHVTKFQDSQLIDQKPIAMNIGTKFTIEKLFYNVPVRKKFLKKDASEANIITNLMYRFAIGHPSISFRYVKDSKLIFETKKNSNIENNLMDVFGIDLYQNLISVETSGRHFKLVGFISNNSYYRANRGMQYFYINHRYIENLEIRKMIEKNYKSIIPNGRFPVFLLYLDIDAQLVDVNIHPNKQTANISILEEILDAVNQTVLKSLNQSYVEHKFEQERATQPAIFTRKEPIVPIDRVSDLQDNYSISTVLQNKTPLNADQNKENYVQTYEQTEFLEDKSPIFDFSKPNQEVHKSVLLDSQELQKEKKETVSVDEVKNSFDYRSLEYIGTIFHTYLILENHQKEELYLFDQHACHERILYEKFMSDFKNEKLVIQDLIAPYFVQITDHELQVYEQHKDIFKNLGFAVDYFGDHNLIVRSVPILLGITQSEQLVRDILDLLLQHKNLELDLIEQKIIKNACKNAIKAGDTIDNIEIDELILNLFQCEYPYTCPHGRPTYIIFTKIDFEKQFMRIK